MPSTRAHKKVFSGWQFAALLFAALLLASCLAGLPLTALLSPLLLVPFPEYAEAQQKIVVINSDPHGRVERILQTMLGTPASDANGSNLERPCSQHPRCTLRVQAVQDSIDDANVVIYLWTTLNWQGVLSQTLRRDQTSVLYWREANPVVPKEVQESMNILMGTHFDDDIRNPRWIFTRRELQSCLQSSWKRWYKPPAERKKFALAVTSHCKPERMQWLQALARVVPLDIYGSCTNQTLPTGVAFLKVASDYKFFVSVENNHQCGYTSEKLMLGLHFGAVPVYWGDPCVSRIKDAASDKPWFINAGDFQTSQALGDHLLEINSTSAYNQLLAWRWEQAPAEGLEAAVNQKICNSMLGPGGLDMRREAFCTLCDKAKVSELRREKHLWRADERSQ